jgi:LysM repeat protein
MLPKILGFSTTVILATFVIEGNNYLSFAANLNNKISEVNNSYQIAQAQASTYRVKLGDTLGGITNRFGMSLSQLLNYNPQLRSRPNLIYVGETINLGGSSTNSVSNSTPASPPPSGRTYTVRSGDTLGGIAIRHGLSLSTILAYNPHLASRPNSINVGEQINVGSAQIIQRTPSNRTSTPTRPTQPTTPPKTTSTSTRPTQPTTPPKTTSTPTPTTQPTPAPTPTPAPSSTEPRRSVTFSGLPTARREGSNSIGATRGNPDEACTKAGKDMRAIAPENGLGYTFDDYPYFFWYFPGVESNSVAVVFTLISEETREVNGKTRTRSTTVYEKDLNLDKSGIIAFALPPESKPLQEGQEYQWRVQINCSEQTTMFLSYSIERKSTDNPELIEKLENSSVDRHPLIFAESGVWFDALKMIALQLEQAPGEPTLTEDWNNVLKLIGFEDLIGEPIQYIGSNVQ